MLFIDIFEYNADRNSSFFYIDAIAKSVFFSTLYSSLYILQEIRKGYDNNEFKRKRNRFLGLILLFTWIVTTIHFFLKKQLTGKEVNCLKSFFSGLALAVFMVLLICMWDFVFNREKKDRK